jgi:hypothetical protein
MSVEVLRFRESVTLQELQDVVAKFVDLKGCPACGLNGFDLRFELDPRVRYADFARQFENLTEIVSLPADVRTGRVSG